MLDLTEKQYISQNIRYKATDAFQEERSPQYIVDKFVNNINLLPSDRKHIRGWMYSFYPDWTMKNYPEWLV